MSLSTRSGFVCVGGRWGGGVGGRSVCLNCATVNLSSASDDLVVCVDVDVMPPLSNFKYN